MPSTTDCRPLLRVLCASVVNPLLCGGNSKIRATFPKAKPPRGTIFSTAVAACRYDDFAGPADADFSTHSCNIERNIEGRHCPRTALRERFFACPAGIVDRIVEKTVGGAHPTTAALPLALLCGGFDVVVNSGLGGQGRFTVQGARCVLRCASGVNSREATSPVRHGVPACDTVTGVERDVPRTRRTRSRNSTPGPIDPPAGMG